MIVGFIGRALHEFTLAGVNHSIPGNGGDSCINFLPHWQKIVETAFFVPLSIYAVYVTISHLEYPNKTKENGGKITAEVRERLASSLPVNKIPGAGTVELPHRRYVFNFYAGVFFIELIYKTITRTGIFFLNPCHITTSLQLLLLKMPDDHPMTTQIFRFTLYTCPGALIAIAFPILNTRLMIGEVLIYFVQHLLIVLIPLYLMALEGAFIPESTSNSAWPIFSMSIIILYHFLFLQPMSLLTSVNLNCILCPAVSDPFAGRFYRICAICHQCVVVPLIVKLYNYSSQMIAVVIDLYARKPKTM